jgi:hypothetical protein
MATKKKAKKAAAKKAAPKQPKIHRLTIDPKTNTFTPNPLPKVGRGDLLRILLPADSDAKITISVETSPTGGGGGGPIVITS